MDTRLVAHGISSVQDLPIPTWLFYWGAGVVLVVSFVLLFVANLLITAVYFQIVPPKGL